MAMLPLILAGPIVRRVTARSVSVWIALSENTHVTLQLWDKILGTGGGVGVFNPAVDPPIHSVSQDTLRIGDKLHIALVTIMLPPPPSLPLLPGQLYSYNLSFNTTSGKIADLKSEGLLVDIFPKDNEPLNALNYALGYLPGFLPSFVLPPVTIDKLNLVHGSCRKFHGPGNDTLAALDLIIKKAVNANDPLQRPHQLYLTGDQIYADEIPMVLLPKLNALGQQLLGLQERLTAKKKDGATGTYAANLDNFPANRRQRLVTRNAHFSTDEGSNHLLSFGEYAACYLMAWNNQVWPEVNLKTCENFQRQVETAAFHDEYLKIWEIDNIDKFVYKLTPLEKELVPLDADLDESQWTKAKKDGTDEERNKRLEKEYIQEIKGRFETEVQAVEIFRTQLPKVRRVLANVPVYMILDDHEVTDDWYITKDWRDKVLTSPLGVNILRNALMAYTLFQDWGNNPAVYVPPDWSAHTDYQNGDFIKPTTANGHLYKAVQTGKSDATQPVWTTLKNDFFSDNTVLWQEAGPDSKPGLLNNLKQAFPAGTTTGPVQAAADSLDTQFGFSLIDETPPPVLWHYAVPCSETTVYVLDTRTRRTYETRKGPPGLLSKSAMDDQIPLNPQPEHFLIFVSPAPVVGLGVLEELIQPTVTVFNDYNADPEPWSFNAPVFEEFFQRLEKFKRVVFLSGDVHFGLASTLDYWKGAATPSRFVQFVSSAFKNQKFLNEQFLMGGMIQKLLGSLFHPAERLAWEHRAGLVVNLPAGKSIQPVYRLRLRKEPVLLPTKGWPAGTTITPGPEWCWRVRLAQDQRVESDRPEKIRLKPLAQDYDPTTNNPATLYKEVLARHMELSKKNVARTVEWENNIGLIKFTTDGLGRITISQELWYWLPEEESEEDPDAYTVYTLSLEPSSDAPPSIT